MKVSKHETDTPVPRTAESDSGTKTRWLDMGLAVLGTDGPKELTIDGLCRRLKLTKGSFYHHFRNRKDYIDTLLAFWHEQRTQRLIDSSRSEVDPVSSIRRLTIMSMELRPARLETAIRAWAESDEQVAAHQARVDADRRAYLTELVRRLRPDLGSDEATNLATLIFAVHVGAQHMSPPLEGEELKGIYESLLVILKDRPSDTA